MFDPGERPGRASIVRAVDPGIGAGVDDVGIIGHLIEGEHVASGEPGRGGLPGLAAVERDEYAPARAVVVNACEQSTALGRIGHDREHVTVDESGVRLIEVIPKVLRYSHAQVVGGDHHAIGFVWGDHDRPDYEGL